MLLLINDQLYNISCVGWHHHSHSCWAAPPQQGIFIPWDSNLRFPSLTLISVVCCFQGKGWKMHVMWGLFHTGLFSVRSYMDFELGMRPGWPEVRTIFAHVLHVKQSWRPVSSAQYENWALGAPTEGLCFTCMAIGRCEDAASWCFWQLYCITRALQLIKPAKINHLKTHTMGLFIKSSNRIPRWWWTLNLPKWLKMKNQR